MRQNPVVQSLLFLVCALVGLAFVSPATLAAEAPGDPSHYWFDPATQAGRTFTYALTTTGSIQIQTPDAPAQTDVVELSAMVALVLAAADPSGRTPFNLHFTHATSEGFAIDLGEALSGLIVEGALDQKGTLVYLKTPAALLDLGIDLRDLFFGLFVPGPRAEVSVGTPWEINFTREDLGPSQNRTLRLRANYTRQGLKEWGNRIYEAVTGGVRGTTSWREGSSRTDVEEIGHALFYVDPQSGRTAVSSVSTIITVEVVDSRHGTIRSRNTLTTTLELQEEAGLEVPASPITPDVPDPSDPPEASIPSDPSTPSDPPVVPDDPVLPSTPPTGTGEVEPTAPHREYQDPAGRFVLVLPDDWPVEDAGLTLRTTTLSGKRPGEWIYIHVVPLPSPGASALNIARSAITSYQETQAGFTLQGDLVETTLAGESAYLAHYIYDVDPGVRHREWALFARFRDRAYYVQYAAPVSIPSDEVRSTLLEVARGFHFGPTPRGVLSAEQLAASLVTYTDPDGRFSVLVPSLWPRVDRSAQGETTTFAEIGESGFLTIFAQPGASGLDPMALVAAWKKQWEQELDFTLIQDVTQAPLLGRDGALIQYRWASDAQTTWTRRLQATVIGDYLYAIALDYVEPGFGQRIGSFDQIFESFGLGEETPAQVPAQVPSPVDPPDEAGSLFDDEPTAPVEEDKVVEEPEDVEQIPLPGEEAATPVSEEGALPHTPDHLILLGRIGNAYPSQPSEGTEWVKNAVVTVRYGIESYTVETDEEGYFFLPNLPPPEGTLRYSIVYLEGDLFGLSQAGINFDRLNVATIAPGVAHAGTIVLYADERYSIVVDIDRSVTASSYGKTALERFIEVYPEDPWTELVRAALVPLAEGSEN